MNHPITLTIAGSDSSGGAGIQADLKTFSALATYGTSVITAITAQNTKGVQAVCDVPPNIIAAQIDSLFCDLKIEAIKIGMVANVDTIKIIAEKIKNKKNIILDPVMVATSGDVLIAPPAINEIKKILLPMALLITPNLHEAAKLLNTNIAKNENEMEAQAKEIIAKLNVKNILLKGGHTINKQANDVLIFENKIYWFNKPFVDTKNTHGTGCSLSSAIAAELAKGQNLIIAVEKAKNWLHNSIVYADKLNIGNGRGPIHHFHNLW